MHCGVPVRYCYAVTHEGASAPSFSDEASIKHLFLAESDYAASGNAFSLALRSVGEETRCLIGRNHIYAYPHQGELINTESAARVLTDAIEHADWVWVIQSELPAIMGGVYGSIIASPQRDAWVNLLRKKKVGLLHGGGHYRDHREYYQYLWQDVADLSICYEADLMGSFKNEHLVIPPLNPSWVPRYERTWGELRIGHFPSRPTDKGSEKIIPLLDSKPVKFFTSVTDTGLEEGVRRVTWESQLKRMAECDAIIDQIKPELNGKKFGEWVSIATETAMMGRIPIANSLNPQPYKDTYGIEPGIHICNDIPSLDREVDRLMGLSDNELRKEQRECYLWAEQHHSMVPTGKLLLQLIGGV